MTELQRLADTLAADYLHGRWQPEPTEEHRARTLAVDADADGGLDELPTGGVLTTAAIAQMLRRDSLEAEVERWRLTEVLRAYPAGGSEAQALVRDLLHAIATDQLPGERTQTARYVEALALHTGGEPKVFTAGGITGAWNWQLSAALQLLSTCPATVLNPRRENFPIHDPVAAPAQIAWEFDALRSATAILFWFPAGPVQPIALYELGAHAARGATIAVGTDPAYARRLDVVEQLRHARPELTVHTSLPDTVRAVTELLPATAGLTTTGL
ncbi:nucleoside 2-deoxyribosyltransferase domain-containing protein [Streptomyces sp. NPDC006704]|uniref:nucleoside 2-deoxyribosyltransferase domain-containing protein n=1 Tax=Streptomyces sp. NPDC006704 TaxID=3364760 RepID=UPI00367408E5